MDISVEKLSSVIDQAGEELLDIINALAEDNYYKDSRIDYPGLPVLTENNTEFYRQRSFEDMLEYNVLMHFINPVFRSLFEYLNIPAHFYIIDGRVEHSDSTVVTAAGSWTIVPLESNDPIQFKFQNGAEIVGIKYTVESPYYNDEDMLKDYGVDRVEIIQWYFPGSDFQRYFERSAGRYNTQSIKRISMEDFFSRYFSEDAYKPLLDKFVYYIQKARDAIGYQTISTPSLHNMSLFRDEVLNTLQRDETYEDLHYHVIDKTDEDGNMSGFIGIDGFRFTASDYDCLFNRFVNEGRYKALAGSEPYARSFATAEYLYSIFKAGSNIDYTAVICGYLKCVEQLMHKIIRITMNYYPDNNLWIDLKMKTADKGFIEEQERKGNVKTITLANKKKRTKIRLLPEFEKHFETTFGSMSYCYNAGKRYWIPRNISIEDIRGIINCYISECRNEHFHKDNISEYDLVNYIRQNTILVLFLLLGGCKLTGSLQQDLDELGILDDSYSRLYKAMNNIPRSVTHFSIDFGNCVKKCFRLCEQDFAKYDKNGLITETGIKFAVVDSFDRTYEDILCNVTAEDLLILDGSNMPESIECHLRNGRVKPVKW